MKDSTKRALTRILITASCASAVFLTGSLTAQEDTAPAQLVEFSFSPTNIDVSGEAQTVIVTLRITDNLSGFSGGGFAFVSPSGQQTRGYNFGHVERISGTDLDGVYQLSLVFPVFSEAGTWRVQGLVLFDQVGNRIDLSTADFETMGFPTELLNTPDTDGDGIPNAEDNCPQEAPAGGLDADLDGCTDTIAGLRAIIEALSLKPNTEGGLLGKLDEARKALDRGNTPVAENKLRDFINQVEAQRGKALSNSEAVLLVTYARNLLLLI